MNGQDSIILGEGIFAINGVDIAFTRGGGAFKLVQELKDIQADGDFGSVIGRRRVVKAQPELSLKSLEIKASQINKLYPAKTLVEDAVKYTVTGEMLLKDSDYMTVTWTGSTLDGRPVVITVYNAINTAELNFAMVDKDEIVPDITFVGHYRNETRKQQPWDIKFYKNISVDTVAPSATMAAPTAGSQNRIVIEFNEKLNATTYAITDRAALLASLKNDASNAVPTDIVITTSANTVMWLNTDTANPMAVITIPATTFVSTQTVKANFLTDAVKDVAGNAVLTTMDVVAVVI